MLTFPAFLALKPLTEKQFARVFVDGFFYGLALVVPFAIVCAVLFLLNLFWFFSTGESLFGTPLGNTLFSVGTHVSTLVSGGFLYGIYRHIQTLEREDAAERKNPWE